MIQVFSIGNNRAVAICQTNGETHCWGWDISMTTKLLREISLQTAQKDSTLDWLVAATVMGLIRELFLQRAY
jgi:hypothetical protein